MVKSPQYDVNQNGFDRRLLRVPVGKMSDHARFLPRAGQASAVAGLLAVAAASLIAGHGTLSRGASDQPADTPRAPGSLEVGSGAQSTKGAPVAGFRLSGPPEGAPADEPIPAKVYRYAERLVRQRDQDEDGKLDRLEWARLWGFLTTDADLDGLVSLQELVGRIVGYGWHRRIRLMPPLGEGDEVFPPLLNPTTDSEPDSAAAAVPAEDNDAAETSGEAEPFDQQAPRRDTKFFVAPTRRPEGLPSWFVARDADGDGQLSMAEFAPKATSAALAEFARFDRDGDGVITPGEYVRMVKAGGEGEDR